MNELHLIWKFYRTLEAPERLNSNIIFNFASLFMELFIYKYLKTMLIQLSKW
jgi:hypothetical protein